MQVTINGSKYDFDNAATVNDVVEKLQLDLRKIAIERNLEIVPRSQYGITSLNDGDQLEIVEFIGGG